MQIREYDKKEHNMNDLVKTVKIYSDKIKK